MQDLPDSCDLMGELLQSAVVGVDLHAAEITGERGALGLYLTDLAPAYIFRRPPDVEPYSRPELRRRAAAVVDSLVDGTFHLRWHDFIRPALQLNATADADCDDDVAMEEAAADDYDGMPVRPAPVLGDMSDRELRKSAYLCFKGGFGMSWRCHPPSPSANPL